LGEKEEEEEPESLEASVQWRAGRPGQARPGQAGKWERRPKLLAALISRSPGLLYVVAPLSYIRRMDIKYRSLLFFSLSADGTHATHTPHTPAEHVLLLLLASTHNGCLSHFFLRSEIIKK
jgi:hypothetical protein